MAGLSGPGMEMLARCIERNVDDAAFATNSIIGSLEAKIDMLEEQLEAAHEREDRAYQRVRWLLGYESGEAR